MRAKKGMELSLTVIVLIILTIIIFIGGIALVWKFFGAAEDIKGGIEMSTQQQIEALLRQGNELVAIPVNTKTVTTNKEVVFGLGVRNIKDAQNFFVRLDFVGLYDRQGQVVDSVTPDEAYLEQEWLGNFKEQGPVSIARNKYEIIPLRVRAASTVADGQQTPRGALAVFNVCVCENNPCGDCVAGSPVYDKIRQVFVEIK